MIGKLLLWLGVNLPSPLSEKLIWLSWKARGLEFGKDHQQIVEDFIFERKYKLWK